MIVHTASVAEVEVAPKVFFDRVRARLAENERLVTFYGGPGSNDDSRTLTVVFLRAPGVEVVRTEIETSAGFHSLTRDFPATHIFEREIRERWDLEPRDHPWLKPVRFSGKLRGKTSSYPFYRVEGKEVHEVGVGPIHAGVIEPGHFRFMCLGETVHHLEIQLGYQHRGVEDLLLRRPPWALAPLVETIAGDTSIAHAWAYASALEALAGLETREDVSLVRGIGLELERIAMHLASLSGLFADIASLQGASTYGRLRTTAINTTMLLCGSRFGRGWVRPAAARVEITPELAANIRENLGLVRRDVAIINKHLLGSRAVAHRLQGVGVVSSALAARMGFVGMVARSCGLPLDARSDANAGAPYHDAPPAVVTEPAGDCWARALLRIREIDASLDWIEAALTRSTSLEAAPFAPKPLQPKTLSVGIVEGWRGEVVHALETDATGKLAHYRVQDPSLRNWFALAMAVRDNEIYDFPICNKSFDLSYCGNDL